MSKQHEPGVLYIGRIRDMEGLLMNIIMLCWPLLAIILVTVAISGIFIWMFDSHWNPQDFPRPFLSGYWEGIWWAFVTMTTVGYGDRAPKSIPGRIYTCFWILYGVCIIAVFTATMTSSLNTESTADMNLQGKTIGVIGNSHEHHLAISMGANVEEYKGFDSLKFALLDGAVDGILLEAIRSLFYQEWLEENLVERIEIKGTIAHHLIHGILARDLGARITCFVETLRRLRPSQYPAMMHYMTKAKQLTRRRQHGEGLTTSLLFNSVATPIISLAIIWVTFFIVMVLCECFYLKPHREREISKEISAPSTKWSDYSMQMKQVKVHNKDIKHDTSLPK